MDEPGIVDRRIVVAAPQPRVWKALTEARQFGTWFQVALDGEFAAGQRITGRMTYPGHEGTPFAATVERIEPQTRFAFRWPNPEDPRADEADAPCTLVEFTLQQVPEGTLLRVVESGFDAIPAARRALALRGNDEGWTLQLAHIKDYAEKSA